MRTHPSAERQNPDRGAHTAGGWSSTRSTRSLPNDAATRARSTRTVDGVVEPRALRASFIADDATATLSVARVATGSRDVHGREPTGSAIRSAHSIPKAFATSRPTLPSPTNPSILPRTITRALAVSLFIYQFGTGTVRSRHGENAAAAIA